jgi:hypothetical protein
MKYEIKISYEDVAQNSEGKPDYVLKVESVFDDAAAKTVAQLIELFNAEFEEMKPENSDFETEQ